MTEPTHDEVQRGVDALTPFVAAWSLPLNPEELGEMAYAVLLHSRSVSSLEETYVAVQRQVADLAEAHRRMLEALGRAHRDRDH